MLGRIIMRAPAKLPRQFADGPPEVERPARPVAAPKRHLARFARRWRDEDAIAMVSEAVGAGGAGVCMGRNAFQREDTAAFLGRIVDAVHGAPR